VRDRSPVTDATLEQLGRDFDMTGLHAHDPWGTLTTTQMIKAGAANATVSPRGGVGGVADATQPQHYVRRRNRDELDVVLSNPNPAVLDYAALVAAASARVAVVFRVPQSYLTRAGCAMMSWVRAMARADRLVVIDGSARARAGQWLIFSTTSGISRRIRPGAPIRTLV
jgi:hypothetical protein